MAWLCIQWSSFYWVKQYKKKQKKKKEAIPLALFCCFSFVSHILMWSIAIPVANDVAQLACLLRCLPPEQYTVTSVNKNDHTRNPDIEMHESDGFIVLIKQICSCVTYCSGHLWSCPPSSCWRSELQWRHVFGKLVELYIYFLKKTNLFFFRPMCIWATDAEIKICVT